MAAGEPHARLYVRRDGTRAIVAIVHQDQSGTLFEAPGPLALTRWDDEILGEAVRTALEQSAMVTRDPRSTKGAPSTALAVSGEPSPRSFEAAFVQIEVFGLDRVEIRARPDSRSELTVTATASGHVAHAELGRLLNKIYAACRDRKL